MKNILIVLLMAIPLLGAAQKPVMTFEKTTHDFGTIAETGGNAVYEFVFKNTGSVPLIITNVRASCGCTTPTWTREPVAPNQTGSVKVSYDPRNRPGKFSKSITVSSNADQAVSTLFIRGNVTKKPADPYQDYRFSIGELKANATAINLGNITNKDVVEKNIDLVYTGEQPLRISVEPKYEYITVSVTPEVLTKGQQGKINIKYDAGKKNDWDFVTDKLTIRTSANQSGDIIVSANIREDFSAQQAENYVNSPVGVFSENEINLGPVAKNNVTKHEFYLENKGKSNLILRKIKTSDNSVVVSPLKNPVKPGKKAKMTITYTADDKPGKNVKVIYFLTNDPKNPTTTYKLTAEVE